MKKFLLHVCVLGFSVASLVSCYQYEEEELYEFCDLSVSNHTSLTRSGSNESFGIIQNPNENNEYYYKKNTEYPIEPNCCFLSAIVDQWISEKPASYFYDPNCRPNANDYYHTVKTSFKEANPDWNEGDPVGMDAFMDFAGDITIGSGNNEHNMFSGDVTFDSSAEASLFFNVSDNWNSVSAIFLQHTDGTGHIAHVKSCNSSQIEFGGEDILGNGGRISVGGENGWRIVGVLLK